MHYNPTNFWSEVSYTNMCYFSEVLSNVVRPLRAPIGLNSTGQPSWGFSPPMPMGPERQGWSRECLSQQCHRSACPSPPLLLLYLASSLIPELASHQGAVGLGLPLTHREKFCCNKPVKTLFSSCRKSLFFIHITHLIQFSPTSCATPID